MLNVVHVLVCEIGVGNDAVVVIVFSSVERHIFSEIDIRITHVISDNINHHPDVSSMTSRDERLEMFFTTEERVNLGHVLSSIAMIVIGVVIRDGGDPNGIETQILDVVQIILDSLEVTTAVVRLGIQIASRSSTASKSESVSDDLIDVTGFPFLSSLCRCGGNEQGDCQKGES